MTRSRSVVIRGRRTRHAASGLHGRTREGALCAEPGCPAAVSRNRRLAHQFVSSKTPKRIPSRLGMRGASKRSVPATPRGSKTAHADFLMVLSSAPAPPQPTPAGQSTAFTARQPPFEVAAAAMPPKTAQSAMLRSASTNAFLVSVDSALPPLTPLKPRAKNTPAKLGHPRALDRDGEISRDRPVSFAP